MKRKVIQLAGKTLVVSLPIKWAEKYKMKKGDEVDVIDEGASLRILKDLEEKGGKKIQLDLSNASRELTRAVLSAAYKQGYDEIIVKYDSKEVYDAIQEKKREVLLGFTIQEMGENKLMLGSFTHDEPKEFQNSLRRAFLVTIKMGEGLLDAVKKKNFSDLQNIRLGENTNNQLTSFCERLINKGFVEPSKASFYYVVCWNLEKACDPYKEIISLIENTKNASLSNDAIELMEMVNDYMKRYYDSFYNYDLNKMVILQKDKKAIFNEAKTMFKNKSEFECTIISYLLEIAALTSNFFGPVNALNIEKLADKKII